MCKIHPGRKFLHTIKSQCRVRGIKNSQTQFITWTHCMNKTFRVFRHSEFKWWTVILWFSFIKKNFYFIHKISFVWLWRSDDDGKTRISSRNPQDFHAECARSLYLIYHEPFDCKIWISWSLFYSNLIKCDKCILKDSLLCSFAGNLPELTYTFCSSRWYSVLCPRALNRWNVSTAATLCLSLLSASLSPSAFVC